MTRPVLLFSALALALGAQAQTYYGNGYTIVEQGTVDDRLSGLDAMVFKTIDAYSVQEGLEQLLQGSGWALAGADNADPQIWRLYRQPWPDNKRSINPMPLSQALAWVAGDGWSLVVDPVNRLVSFEVNARYAARPAPTAATVANAPMDSAPLTATGTTRVSPSPYDPYATSVSYADSPSYSASHSTAAGYGGSFSDSSYVASPHAVLLTPPAGDYHDSTFNTPPPRKSVREASALRPATTRLADLKTVSPGTDAEKSGKATAGKKARKSATGTTPALLPVSTGEKTASRSKTATPATATATARTVASASGTKAAATTATEKKTAPNADADRKTATTPATEKAATATRKTATAPAATESKAAAPAAATDTKAAAKPAAEAKAANPDKPPSATQTQATTSSTPPAPAAHTPNATSGENHP
jgi:hypothetical protein